MGLLSTATAANRITERALTVSYSKPRIKGNWSWTNALNVIFWRTQAYEYHRYASCAYRYVGMDYKSAKSAADRIRESYTRAFKISEWNGSGSYAGTFQPLDMGTRLQGSVEVVRDRGHLYDVVVQIDEDDVRLSLDPNRSFAVLFADEDARRYDY